MKENHTTEQQILKDLTENFLTIKEISLRRQISLRTIYRYIKKLKEKGSINHIKYNNFVKGGIPMSKSGFVYKENAKNVTNLGVPIQYSKKDIVKNYVRLHNQKVRVQILGSSGSYSDLLARCNIIKKDHNTLMLYKDCIIVHTVREFVARSAEDAKIESLKYWISFFGVLENDLKITLIKNNYQNIKIYYEEYAEINNGFAKDLNDRKQKFNLRDPDDHKVYAKVDYSKGINEFETSHPKTALKDMQEIFKPFFDDLRKNPVVLSDVVSMFGNQMKITQDNLEMIKILIQSQNKTTQELEVIIKLLQGFLPQNQAREVRDQGTPYYVG